MSKASYIVAGCIGAAFAGLLVFSGKISRAEEKAERPVVPELSEFSTRKHHTEALHFYSLTDEVSGCQYIVVNMNAPAITPRMNADGIHICRRSTP